MSRGRLVVLTGPSGVGKGTVVAQVRRLRPDLWISVSATTRAPRAGEVDGRDYHFWSAAQFAQAVTAGGFLEWAEFAGNRYGTPRQPVEEHLSAGEPVLEPPSFEALEQRLRGRGTEDEAAIARRLDRARAELAAAPEFDVVVLNDDVVRAARELVDFLDDPGHPA
jgi:guanylate kinase